MAGEGMTFQEMQDRAAEMAEMGRYNNTSRPPIWTDLINTAYVEFVWETECYRAQDTFDTVADQAEYPLTKPYWKFVTRCIYGTDSALEKTTEAELDILDPLWLIRDSGTPQFWLWVRPNVLRLWPTPDTADVTVTFTGVRAPNRMTDPNGYPLVQDVYHETICQRAFDLAAKRWATGEELEKLVKTEREYLDWLRSGAANVTQNIFLKARRRRPIPAADRVCL